MADQRGTIKTMALAGKKATDTIEILNEAYGDNAFSRSYVFNLHKQLLEGRESVESGRGKFPKETLRNPENIHFVQNLIKEDARMTIDEIALESGLSHGTVFLILHDDLNLSKKVARWVPRLLSEDHKRQRINMALCFKNRYFKEGEAFLKKIITMDETWISFSTPQLKNQSSQWLPVGSDAPIKARTVGSAKKVMFIVFIDYKGPIYQHFVPKGETINSNYYIEVLSTFLKHLRKKRPEKVADGYIFHQDNARPHVSKETLQFMESKKIPLIDHAPYSPDLAPCDFYFFPQLKKKLAGERFGTLEEVKTAVEGVVNGMVKEEMGKCFWKWIERFEKCIEKEGSYVEK